VATSQEYLFATQRVLDVISNVTTQAEAIQNIIAEYSLSLLKVSFFSTQQQRKQHSTTTEMTTATSLVSIQSSCATFNLIIIIVVRCDSSICQQ
jgi:NifB/MoaA-like Fe-S oxidoreductase